MSPNNREMLVFLFGSTKSLFITTCTYSRMRARGNAVSNQITERFSLTSLGCLCKFVSMNTTDLVEGFGAWLADIARIQPGYLSRSRVRSTATGTHRLLQARDISAEDGLRLEGIARFRPERNPDLYRVTSGDILLAARGQNHSAHLIELELEDVLASNVFYIIRPRVEIVRPSYLAWFLNQREIQAALESASRGTSMGYIARSTLEKLRIVVPTRHVQERIERTIYLWRQRKRLQASLDKKCELLIQTACRMAAHAERE